ncbi:PAS domain-containing protein, partial [Pseudoalteromonas sp. SIMBA_153]
MTKHHITHRIIEQLPTMVAYVDRDRLFRYVNTSYAAFFDLTPQEMLGKPLIDVLSEESHQRIKPNHDHVFASGERMEFSDS